MKLDLDIERIFVAEIAADVFKKYSKFKWDLWVYPTLKMGVVGGYIPYSTLLIKDHNIVYKYAFTLTN